MQFFYQGIETAQSQMNGTARPSSRLYFQRFHSELLGFIAFAKLRLQRNFSSDKEAWNGCYQNPHEKMPVP